MINQQLRNLLKECTVLIEVPNTNRRGTGFFVGNGLVLTCGHVVKDAETKLINIKWQRKNCTDIFEARVLRIMH